MPNLYATPTEIKAAAPDGIRSVTTKYDDELLRLANDVSRFIDRFCKRRFYPISELRLYNGSGTNELWIDDVLTISQLRYSTDNGKTYTALAQSGNWHLTRSGDFNAPGSFNQLLIDPNGARSTFPSGFRSIEITGVFSYSDDQAYSWEDSTDSVQDNPLGGTAADTALEVASAEGDSLFGISPRFQRGLLIRMESEYSEVTSVNKGTEILTIIRNANGTTVASHAQNIQIDIWRPPDPVRRSAIIQSVIQLQRGFEGFGDARAQPDLGQMFFIKELDPQARLLLTAGYIKQAVG